MQFDDLRKRALLAFKNFNTEVVECAISDVTLKILSGQMEESSFFVGVKYAILQEKTKSSKFANIDDICVKDDVDPVNEFIENDFYTKAKKNLDYHLDNTLVGKQRQAIINRIAGQENLGDPNYKQALRKLREVMSGSITNRGATSIRNIRKTRFSKTGNQKNIDLVDLIRTSDLPDWAISEKYGINARSVKNIRQGLVYKDVRK